mmetsp:Transcript_142593/g.455779  ORF Transcript_142593/g.455779 Transcript_142593/m.455779 type:complete len:224 (+) Transcript_142593:520-1191(+)
MTSEGSECKISVPCNESNSCVPRTPKLTAKSEDFPHLPSMPAEDIAAASLSTNVGPAGVGAMLCRVNAARHSRAIMRRGGIKRPRQSGKASTKRPSSRAPIVSKLDMACADRAARKGRCTNWLIANAQTVLPSSRGLNSRHVDNADAARADLRGWSQNINSENAQAVCAMSRGVNTAAGCSPPRPRRPRREIDCAEIAVSNGPCRKGNGATAHAGFDRPCPLN